VDAKFLWELLLALLVDTLLDLQVRFLVGGQVNELRDFGAAGAMIGSSVGVGSSASAAGASTGAFFALQNRRPTRTLALIGNPSAQAGSVSIRRRKSCASSSPKLSGISHTISSCTCSTIGKPAASSGGIAAANKSRATACTAFSIHIPP